MARFLKSPQQQFVQMGNPIDVQFYSNLLNKAQSDLERGTAIKAAAIEKFGDVEFSSKEDMDAVVGRAQEMLKGATDADFVSPSKVTNAVLQANREIMPGVQAAKAKAKATDMYDRMRMQYGPNFWGGTDPRTQSILDKSTGKYVDPNQFKAVGINAEEVDKLLLASQQQELNYSYETPVKSDLPGYLKINKYTGLADDKREELYAPGTANAIAIAKSQLATMPQLKEVFGSEEAALTRLMERNYQTTGNYKQSVDSQYITDIMGAEARSAARNIASLDAEIPGRPLYDVVPGDVAEKTLEELTSIKEILADPEKASKNRSLLGRIGSALGWDAVANAAESILGVPNKIANEFGKEDLYTVPDFNMDNTTPEQMLEKAEDKMTFYKDEYKDIYKSITKQIQKNYSYEQYNANKDKIDKEVDMAFIDKIAPIEVSMRMMRDEMRAFSPAELPKLYDDLLVTINPNNPLTEINTDGTLGKPIKDEDMYGEKGKFNPALSEPSLLINPAKGRIELSYPGEKKRYSVSMDNVDVDLKELFDIVKEANTEYLKILKSGKVPSRQEAILLRQLTNELYKGVYEVYSK